MIPSFRWVPRAVRQFNPSIFARWLTIHPHQGVIR
ncbi:hypothetical protein MILUP08_46543 [Micromonospora lupini str. Lupac 08]|uniref:Uncharacterized protein n=1 Tax=Micromonospora lupini str. Lupac 08 TaxID=1150864 RepID=I0LCU7_9ACTN|nr:hypothetical protein MILUP08_46543 [Micromonospora lupini str. Lupac 08]